MTHSPLSETNNSYLRKTDIFIPSIIKIVYCYDIIKVPT